MLDDVEVPVLPPPPPQPPNIKQTRTITERLRRAERRDGISFRARKITSMSASNVHNSTSHGAFDGPVGAHQPSGGGKTYDCAVVCTVSVTLAGLEESIFTVEDENEQVAPLGAPVQASDTGRSKPLAGVRVSV